MLVIADEGTGGGARSNDSKTAWSSLVSYSMSQDQEKKRGILQCKKSLTIVSDDIPEHSSKNIVKKRNILLSLYSDNLDNICSYQLMKMMRSTREMDAVSMCGCVYIEGLLLRRRHFPAL